MEFEFERDYDMAVYQEAFPRGRDSAFIRKRLLEVPTEVTARDASGRVLEVAAAEAVHSCKLSLRGLTSFILDPSPTMLEIARQRMQEYGAHLTMVRGIAEALPFEDHTFDRVLCESAIDHLPEPDLGVREMVRVLKPDGRLVIGAVNYGGAAVQLSRLAYRLGRRLGRIPESQHLFWDTPVPYAHTFECTYRVLREMCGRYCELDRMVGVSLGWNVLGWSRFLERLPAGAVDRLLANLDHVARRVPPVADYVLGVWKPRAAARPGLRLPKDERVHPRDPAYRWRIDTEATFRATKLGTPPQLFSSTLEWLCTASLTGDAARPWRADLVARGPYARSAALGCDGTPREGEWLADDASGEVDVYELSRAVIRRLRRSVPRRAHLIQADLNFVSLPAARYDLILASGYLHHVLNLERLLGQVASALRPGGLFAVFDYVGKRRFDWEPARLARVQAALELVPKTFWREGTMGARIPALPSLAPFCAVRSDDMLAQLTARFEVVHQGYAGSVLFPLAFHVDFDAIRRDAPEILEPLAAAEDDARRDPALPPCLAYLVLRPRS